MNVKLSTIRAFLNTRNKWPDFLDANRNHHVEGEGRIVHLNQVSVEDK